VVRACFEERLPVSGALLWEEQPRKTIKEMTENIKEDMNTNSTTFSEHGVITEIAKIDTNCSYQSAVTCYERILSSISFNHRSLLP